MGYLEDTMAAAYADMDPTTGMFPADWTCLKCGKVLNADGGHPAELYAGTFTGLCYRCSNGPRYVQGIRVLDGGVVWNYPPHCPSWRRDREIIVLYWDCPSCHGTGRYHSWDHSGSCDVCAKRSYHPAQRAHHGWSRRVYDAAQARYERQLSKAAKLPKRMGKKRRAEAVLAFTNEHPDETEAIRSEVLADARRVLNRLDARAERQNLHTTLSPEQVTAALLAIIR